jgi:signal transduction histidine kinase
MTVDSVSQGNAEQGERLRALYHLSVELSALHSLDTVLNTALTHCLDLTNSQFGFVGLTAATGKAMDVAAVQGFHPANQFYEHFHLIPLRPNIFARVVLENCSVRSEDAMSDPRRIGQPKGHPPVHTFLGVPLRIREAPIGMIGVANRATPYDDEHEHLLMTYAAQVAIVIRNAQLYEELKTAKTELEQKVADRTQELQRAKEALAQKATQLRQLFNETVDIQEHERQRIAQDMHDGINQLLIGSMLELKSARERISAGKLSQAEEALQSVQTILHDVEAEINQIIYDLRPPTLDTLGFVPALRRYIQDFKRYAGIECKLTVRGKSVRLPSREEGSIYRLFQEALQNVYAHAQASHVDVTVSFSPESLELIVSDDGSGFDKDAILRDNSHHYGLITMQERTKSLAGELSIQSELGQGTKITLTIPIRDAT